MLFEASAHEAVGRKAKKAQRAAMANRRKMCFMVLRGKSILDLRGQVNIKGLAPPGTVAECPWERLRQAKMLLNMGEVSFGEFCVLLI